MTKDRIIETLGSELLNKRGLAQKLGFEIFMPEALMRSGKKDESLDMWRIAHCSITTLKIPLVARSANKICLHKLPRGGAGKKFLATAQGPGIQNLPIYLILSNWLRQTVPVLSKALGQNKLSSYACRRGIYFNETTGVVPGERDDQSKN